MTKKSDETSPRGLLDIYIEKMIWDESRGFLQLLVNLQANALPLT